MEEVVRKEILYDLDRSIAILKTEELQDIEELKELSNHAIDDVAAHKDLDLVTITVLIYSLYKTCKSLGKRDHDAVLRELENAKRYLSQHSFSRYNSSVRNIFTIIRRSDEKVKEHLNDVMHAAKIKKGTVLLERGLSIGQAAGLMGLSNWDLQSYAGRSTALVQHQEIIPVKKRVLAALKIFGVS
ncbi:hypothetical protein HYT52_02410 [Candidatus Woesearchaeota archaeon]|nr:hypothetical protein [Candidatus Woesearchaeota archaeon]